MTPTGRSPGAGWLRAAVATVEGCCSRLQAGGNRRLAPYAQIAAASWPLASFGTLMQFGWEKALGDDAELSWWQARALGSAREL